MIDTLILSGGGPSGICYIGIYQALLEKKFLEKNNINEIITTSIGILFSFCILIKIDLVILKEIILKYKMENYLNYSDIDINSLLEDYGLFETSGIENIMRVFIKKFLNKDDISLQEFYNINKIKLNVKVYNTTTKSTEYISYINYPDLSLITLAKMTTAIPLVFKPVSYNDNLYVDGGIRGSLPIEECKGDKYIAFNVHGNSGHIKDPLLNYIGSLMLESNKIENNNNILNLYPELGLNFDIKEETKLKIIEEAYIKCIDFLKNH